jgi:hypothetical protein
MIKHWDAIQVGRAPKDQLLDRAERYFFESLCVGPYDESTESAAFCSMNSTQQSSSSVVQLIFALAVQAKGTERRSMTWTWFSSSSRLRRPENERVPEKIWTSG